MEMSTAGDVAISAEQEGGRLVGDETVQDAVTERLVTYIYEVRLFARLRCVPALRLSLYSTLVRIPGFES